MTTSADAIVVGAGLAGISCARRLAEHGLTSLVLEASDGIGGRVRTDELGGFRLDRGFQVLLTAYPEARAILDYGALDLGRFYPGALVRSGGRFHRVADPWRRPLDGISGALSPIGSLADKLRVARLRHRACSGDLEGLFRRPETTTERALQDLHFSPVMVERFFRPFLGGVMLDRRLRPSSRMLEFVLRMFAEGDAALPAAGMGAIPDQLARALPSGSIRLRTPIASVGAGHCVSYSGETFAARSVVVATEGPVAARLVGAVRSPGSRPVTCVYFAAEVPPVSEPILVLDGDGDGPVNNLCVPSAVSPAYAPAGAALVSATVLDDDGADDEALVAAVRRQLGGWFGSAVASWRHLRTYRIPHALPDHDAPSLASAEQATRVRPGLYVCGDHRATASIQGAMVSGRHAADAVAGELREARAA